MPRVYGKQKARVMRLRMSEDEREKVRVDAERAALSFSDYIRSKLGLDIVATISYDERVEEAKHEGASR